MIKTPSVAKLALKAVAAAVLAFFLIMLLLVTIESVGSGMYGATDADLVSWCEDDYYARNYENLYETLTLFDLYDTETYGVYWEAVEGYDLLIDYETWSNADDTARADASLAALEALAEHPTYERNKPLLEGLLAETEK